MVAIFNIMVSILMIVFALGIFGMLAALSLYCVKLGIDESEWIMIGLGAFLFLMINTMALGVIIALIGG